MARSEENERMLMAWRTGHYDFRYHFKEPKGGRGVKVMLFLDDEFCLVCPRCDGAALKHPTLPPDELGYYRAICPEVR